MTPVPPRRGIWVAASLALDRDVPLSAPYPHTCYFRVEGEMTGRIVEIERRDCGACGDLRAARAAARAAQTATQTTTPPPETPGGVVP